VQFDQGEPGATGGSFESGDPGVAAGEAGAAEIDAADGAKKTLRRAR
jgi:hypothetical protein